MQVIIYDTVCLKIVHTSLAMLYLYRFCTIFVSPLNWLSVFNLKVKKLAFDTRIKNDLKCIVFYEELYAAT